MKKQKKWKPRINPNDSRFTTKVIQDKKHQVSKDLCRKFKKSDYDSEL